MKKDHRPQLFRSKNLSNSVWNIANTVIYPVAFLAATPFFLDHLGEHVFGTWMTLNALVFISVQVLHFGTGESVSMYVAEARGKQNQQRLMRYFNSAFNFSALLALGVTALAVVLWVLPPSVIPRVASGLSSDDLKIALVLTLFTIASKFFEQLFGSFFKGFEEYGTAARFNMGQKLAMLLLQVGAVVMGYGLPTVLLMAAGSNTLLAMLQFIWSRRYLPGHRWEAKIDPLIFGRLRSFGFWTWLQTLVALLGFQLDRLIVAFALGTHVVAYYSLASMIANHIHMVLEATVSWIFPMSSRMAGEKRDTTPLYVTVRGFVMSLSLVGLLALGFLSDPIFGLWLGAEKYRQMQEFIRLFILLEVFYVATIVPKFYLHGIGELRLIAGIEIGYKTLGVAVMLAAFALFGTATSLIWGQVVVLMLAAPLEMLIINSRVLRASLLHEVILCVLPCFLTFGALYRQPFLVSALMGLSAMVVAYVAYFRHPGFRFKLLMQ